MYQILQLKQIEEDKTPVFCQTKYFFLEENNAVFKMKEIIGNRKSKTWTVVYSGHGQRIQRLAEIKYPIKKCYKVIKIVPYEEHPIE